MRIALVHDWLTGMRGGERCLEVLCEMYPRAHVYTLLYQPERITPAIRCHVPEVSWMQRIPGVQRFYRYLLPLFPIFVRDLNRRIKVSNELEGYDVVISVSHCVAKNISVPEGTTHICYCLSPMRYLWDQYDAYFKGKAIEPLVRLFAGPLRRWDVRRAAKVDHFVGISEFVKARIGHVYGRDASVIYPPVRTDWIAVREPEDSGEGFLVVNALVPYKNTEYIVRAFNELGLPLTVVGSGPEEASLKQIAKPNIRFIKDLSDEQLGELYRRSKALIFAAEEDFGMTPVEMQAAGRPVIAYGRGGALETVTINETAPSGLLFPDLTTESISRAVQCFLDHENSFTVENCVKGAEKFSEARFQSAVRELLSSLGIHEERDCGQAALRRGESEAAPARRVM